MEGLAGMLRYPRRVNAQEVKCLMKPWVDDMDALNYRLAEQKDLRAMYDLWMAYHLDGGIDYARTYEDHCRAYLDATNFDLARDVMLAERGDELVAYGFTRWSNMPLEDAFSFDIVVYVSPACRNRGIGSSLLAWGEQKVRSEAAGHPDALGKYIKCFAREVEKTKISLLERNGYRRVDEYAILVRPTLEDIPLIEPPEGIVFRPLDVKDARQLWDAIQEAFRDHVDYEETTDEDFITWQKAYYFQPELACVAWDGDEIVGQIMNFINHEENARFNRKRGYTEWISVRRPWRRRGIARAMLARSLAIVKEAGMEEAALEVHVTNPHEAYALYREMGFKLTTSEYTYRKDL